MDKYLICDDSKKAKRRILKSSDVVVTPLISSEMNKLIEHESDDALKAQYMNMLDRASKDPENSIWYTYWDVSLKKDEKQSIGCLYFDGPQEYGAVTLSFKTNDSRYNWDKRIAESLRLITEWALVQKNVYEINTYIDSSLDGNIRNAERADFVWRDKEKGIEHYSKEAPVTSWLGLYIVIGIIVGFLMGLLFSSMAIGMAIAVLACVLIGGIMDQNESKKREHVTGQKRQTKFSIAKKKKMAAKNAINTFDDDSSEDEEN